MKPLDRAQLKAWQSYLDWEIAEAETAAVAAEGTAVEGHEDSKQQCVAGHERVLILFERCLIACALYEEFWNKVSGKDIKLPFIKYHNDLPYYFETFFVIYLCALQYVHYLEPRGLEEVRNVYHRACEIHLPYKHSIHLQWALFEEKHGENVSLSIENTLI